MIKFFRRIRQKLLNQGKLKKYLIYAVGEIILVIIGILIALNLNIKSEQSKTEAKIEIILNDVLDELSSNIAETSRVFEFHRQKDSLYFLIMNDRLSREDYYRNEISQLFSFCTSYNNTYIVTPQYNNLISNAANIPIKYKDIVHDLTILNSNMRFNIEDRNRVIGNYTRDVMEYNARNFEWYSSNKKLDERIDYMLNDYRYKNSCSILHNYMIANGLVLVLSYRKQAIETYKKLAKVLNKPSIDSTFKVNSELVELVTGEWQNESNPDLSYSIVFEEDQLYLSSNEGKQEIYPFSEQNFVLTSGVFLTVYRVGSRIYCATNNGMLFEKRSYSQ